MRSVRISVFGSSSCQCGSREYRLAEQVGRQLAQRGVELVNGARTGVMEAASKGAREAGGNVYGVMRNRKSYCNSYVTHTIICDDAGSMSYELSMNIRTGKLLESDSFVVILGATSGKGTYKELCAVVECELDNWDPKRPCAVLFVDIWYNREVAGAFGINLQDKAYESIIETHRFENWLWLFSGVSPKLINFVTGQS